MRRFFLLLSALAVGCGTGAGPADLVLLNGKIVTLEEDRPEARALAARDGRIVALGEDDEIRAHVGPETRVIDLEGRLAVPGFIEGHGHFTGLGRSLTTLDLTGARTWEDVVELAAAAASRAEPGEPGSSAGAGTRRSGSDARRISSRATRGTTCSAGPFRTGP